MHTVLCASVFFFLSVNTFTAITATKTKQVIKPYSFYTFPV